MASWICRWSPQTLWMPKSSMSIPTTILGKPTHAFWPRITNLITKLCVSPRPRRKTTGSLWLKQLSKRSCTKVTALLPRKPRRKVSPRIHSLEVASSERKRMSLSIRTRKPRNGLRSTKHLMKFPTLLSQIVMISEILMAMIIPVLSVTRLSVDPATPSDLSRQLKPD